MLERVLIIGGGVAAMRCALELRTQGYDGRICLVSAETTLPYDRTLVSKELLSGDRVDEARLLLQPSEAYEDAAIDLRLGVRATGLDVRTRRVDLADGTQLGYDRLVLAVGGEPMRPPRLTAPGVLALRELGDARRLADMLDAAGRIVIVGGGFIGTEVASMAAARGLQATVVEAGLPFAPLLGRNVARRICDMHRVHGVELLEEAPVDRVRRNGDALLVELVDGRRLPADVVLAAVGMRPATRWLAASALGDANGIVTDAVGRTTIPGVFAAGDCALTPDPDTWLHATTEHWDVAARQGALVARTILGRPTPKPRPPYFWSDQLGTKLQMIGRTRGADSVEIEDVAPSPCFIARYRHNGRLVGPFAAGAPQAVAQARREIDAAPRAPARLGESPRQFAYPAVRELTRRVRARSAAGTRP
jgi:3-phenylpropionate/trans-cinnamate dioxygenase ferredoxin reductase component